MPASDAIVVGEDWISEHYFTTDATKQSFNARVLERRREWEERKDEGTVRTEFTATRNELLKRFSTVSADDVTDARVLNEQLFHVLGYDAIGLRRERTGPVTRVGSAGLTDSADLAVIDARPVEAIEQLLDKEADNLLEPHVIDQKQELTSVSRTISTLFVGEAPPAFVLVLAGRFALVAERERWPEGRYLAVDLQLVAERNDGKRGGEVDRALTCLSAESLAPDSDGDIWWHATLEDSVKHTVGVSKDLREGVRLSIEIIANEVVSRRVEKGLPPLPAEEAQPLAKQSLRFLYRILFLLYAEASPELGVLPTGAPEYERGYSLDRLRDLTLVELATPTALAGTHLYESLAVLFDLVEGRTRGKRVDAEEEAGYVEGLQFRSLRADLFKPEATAHIDEVGLGNGALQRVLQHLLLSKESRSKDRGFISYAELGINQLGAVYEGLMSYTGFFAETDLYEVAKGGDASKGSWVIPVDRAEGISPADFVRTTDPITGEPKPVLHQRGTFVFRLAGRERQQSASYYTPEVLTRFVVSQALEELLDQNGERTSAEEILELTICEPALGSGAFALEAVRQLADEYLKRRQDELGQRIDPDGYPRELQKVKAYLALHQVYGVDLNATAVELAEISLWLDTMVEGLAAPWFGLHLRRGNSLIGARRTVFRRDQVQDKSWLKAVPTPVPNDEPLAGRIPHFLLPAEGWGAAADVGKDIKELVPEAVADLKTWRRSTMAKPTNPQLKRLIDMGERVERLWGIAQRRLEIANQQIRRDIPLWGRSADPASAPGQGRHVSREEIEETLADVDGAYQRLRRVMDAWCALWFWPLTESEVKPPTLDEWYDALGMLLGSSETMSKAHASKGDDTLDSAATWDALSDVEHNDRVFAGASPTQDVLARYAWLEVCQRVANQQGFFHWELQFAPVFQAGGFDLQVGNPPWVRPRTDVDALLAEGDPWWQLKGKSTKSEEASRREAALAVSGVRDLFVETTGDLWVVVLFAGSAQNYPNLAGLQPDLYRCFMEQAWRHQSSPGVSALIHPETHFTDEKARRLRAATYRRLRRHWQFVNELTLFDIDHHVSFGVHVYGRVSERPRFLMATSLYHPDTVVRSLVHDGSGPEPGLKNTDGNWDVRPHRNRILTVSEDTLTTWRSVLESVEVPLSESRMVYAVNRATAQAMDKLSSAPRLGDHNLQFSRGWDENRQRGTVFDIEWGRAASWRDVILQGPHFHVSVPFYKAPNETMANNLDWSIVDLEKLPPDAVPVTSYKPLGSKAKYDADYNHWGPDKSVAARAHFRVVWRSMAANTGERTLIAALVPPGPAQVCQSVYAAGLPDEPSSELALVAGYMSSLVLDLMVRAVPKSTVLNSVVERLPACHGRLDRELILRTLRLNCLTDAFGDLWVSSLEGQNMSDQWTGGLEYPDRRPLDAVSPSWDPNVPLRRASDRRQALVEIDALVALMLGLTADELCTIYRTQFAVLYGYDRNTYYYDANGRLVPSSVLSVWRKKSEAISEDERTATNQAGNTYTYELPFVTLDREADMRQAYAHFEKVLQERS